MTYFARLENNVVREIAVYDLTLEKVKARYHPSLVWVEADENTREGMIYSDGTFSNGSDDE